MQADSSKASIFLMTVVLLGGFVCFLFASNSDFPGADSINSGGLNSVGSVISELPCC